MSRPQSAARYAWLDLLGSAQTYTGLATFSGGASVTNLTVGGTNTINTSWTLLAASQGGFQRSNDTGYTSLIGGSTLSAANGAYMSLYGNSHATYPGQLYLVPGTAGETYIYNGATARVLETVTGGAQVNGTFYVDGGAGSATAVIDSAAGTQPQAFWRENGNNRSVLFYDTTNHYFIIRKYLDSTPATVTGQILMYDNGDIRLLDNTNSINLYVGGTLGGGYYRLNSEQQMSFAGRVTSTGGAERLPSGWTSSRTTDPGQYRITHNLGTTAYTVTGNVRSSVAGTVICYTYTSTYIDIWTFNAAGTAANYTFHFMVQLHT